MVGEVMCWALATVWLGEGIGWRESGIGCSVWDVVCRVHLQ